MSRPGRVIRVDDGMAEVDIDGRTRWFNSLAVPEVKPGAWVLTHTSLVLAEISEHDAREIGDLLRAGMEVAE